MQNSAWANQVLDFLIAEQEHQEGGGGGEEEQSTQAQSSAPGNMEISIDNQPLDGKNTTTHSNDGNNDEDKKLLTETPNKAKDDFEKANKDHMHKTLEVESEDEEPEGLQLFIDFNEDADDADDANKTKTDKSTNDYSTNDAANTRNNNNNNNDANDSVEDKGQGMDERMEGNCEHLGEEATTDPVHMPLLDYLCAYMQCSLKELQVLFNNIEARKTMLKRLRVLPIRTNHLAPPERNLVLHAHDLSAPNANMAFACGGYLNITVRQYYYIKHGRRLRHPYLPCLMEFGGGSHASYYPLEVCSVLLTHQHRNNLMLLPNATNNNNNGPTTSKMPPKSGSQHGCLCCEMLASF